MRTLIGDSTIPLERARRAVAAALAGELGLGERLVAADRGAPGGHALRKLSAREHQSHIALSRHQCLTGPSTA